jgi:bifunctional UDP-N-acetylglucosamine pyrophosphorylase/glucosamine-1-phosphate N-acetyltransferase
MSRTVKGYNAIVLAAGKGVRMRSRLPKVLHRVCGETLVKRVLRSVMTPVSGVEAQPKTVSVVIGYEADLVRAELDGLAAEAPFSGAKIVTALQAEQHGTGHAAKIGLAELPAGSEPVVILPGDVPLLTAQTIGQLVSAFAAGKAELIFLSCIHPQPDGFGRIVRDGSGRPTAIVEHKDCTPEQRAIREINSSIYIVDAKFLAEALSSLKNDNAQKEYYLTDIVQFGVERGALIEGMIVNDFLELSGANSRAELSALEVIQRNKINQRWMEAGVTLEDPSGTIIDESASIESDCWIGAGTRIYGKSRIETGAVIEGSSIIRDSIIGKDARIKFSCVVDSAVVGPAAQVGPFAHLRPDTELGPDTRIGNFVETKKARLGKGSKANHLTYLGDAEIGEGVNVGAGTITCNYDGWNKSKTVIEDGAFIGSNSSLIAPVTIGAGSVVAAGSAISKNVPANSLGLERSQQVAIEGWAERRRAKLGPKKKSK